MTVKVITLIGLIKGAMEFILPTLKDTYTSIDGSLYGQALTALLIVICSVSIFFHPFLREEALLNLNMYSDISFVVGGIIAFGLREWIDKKISKLAVS